MGEVDPGAAVAVEEELDSLTSMTLAGLRLYWAKRWGAPPRLRSVSLLRHMIAWRLQAELFGGLDAETQHLLKQTSNPRPRLIGTLAGRLSRASRLPCEPGRNLVLPPATFLF
jgi:hypothetical protein